MFSLVVVLYSVRIKYIYLIQQTYNYPLFELTVKIPGIIKTGFA